jgi:hypothetical protein
MKDMQISSVDPILSNAGLDQNEVSKVEDTLQSQGMQDKIAELSKDGLSEAERDTIGDMVANKVDEALRAEGKEGLTADERMAVGKYCDQCLDKQANEAADEAMAELVET